MKLKNGAIDRGKESARQFWESLTDENRWAVGDALVLGDFDWREWELSGPPSPQFMTELDHIRLDWEEANDE